MNELEYIAYFRNLASQHQLIRHDQDGRESFFVVHDDNRSELEKAMRNKVSLPALLLDQYFDDVDTESDNYRQRIQAGFSVICQIENAGHIDSIRAARHQARQIALSVLHRMRRDARMPGAPLFIRQVMISFDHQGEMTPVLGAMTGWGYSFSWLLPTQVAVDPADWKDL